LFPHNHTDAALECFSRARTHSIRVVCGYTTLRHPPWTHRRESGVQTQSFTKVLRIPYVKFMLPASNGMQARVTPACQFRKAASREDVVMIQTLIHHPAADCIALLSLVALVFVFHRLGMNAWIRLLDRRKDKQHNEAAEDYWRIHQ
jgi:hypothetical protein